MQLSIRASLAIHCLILVSEFGETDKITSEKIALSTGTNPVAIRSIMSALKKECALAHSRAECVAERQWRSLSNDRSGA